ARAPGSNVTELPLAGAGAIASNSTSPRTSPGKFAAGPGRTARDPPRVMIIWVSVDAQASRTSIVRVFVLSVCTAVALLSWAERAEVIDDVPDVLVSNASVVSSH